MTGSGKNVNTNVVILKRTTENTGIHGQIKKILSKNKR